MTRITRFIRHLGERLATEAEIGDIFEKLYKDLIDDISLEVRRLAIEERKMNMYKTTLSSCRLFVSLESLENEDDGVVFEFIHVWGVTSILELLNSREELLIEAFPRDYSEGFGDVDDEEARQIAERIVKDGDLVSRILKSLRENQEGVKS